MLSSEEFAPAFAQSEDIMDYRWGKLHRIVFRHPLNGDPLNIPNGGGFTDLAPDLQHPVERTTIADLWAKFPQDEVDLTPTPLSS